jgi:uncharacterized protein (DUF885 family)
VYTQQNAPTNDIEGVFDAFFREMIELDPEFATQLGIPEQLEFNIAYDALTDVSKQAINRQYDLLKEYQAKLRAINSAQLTSSQQLSKDILLWYIDNSLYGEKFRYHNSIVDPIFGVHNSLTTLMVEYHRIETMQDIKNYITRLEKYPQKLEQLLEGLRIRREMGIIAPKCMIEKTKKIMLDFIRINAEENVLYTSFREKLLNADSTEFAFHEQVKHNIERHVYPSYQKFIKYLDELMLIAKNDVGLWRLPEGEDYYRYCLRSHTTINLSPKEIHNLGREEVERIQEDAINILISLGFTERKSFGLMMNQYWRFMSQKNNLNYFYRSTDHDKKRVVEDYRNILSDVQNRLPDLFSLIPETPVIVKPVPDFKEITMGAHYEPASLDGQRKGIFYVNLANLPFKPRMKSLAYHEGIPGHHFQIALQQESSDIRLFRNLLHFTGFIEGWALYAEKLGMENGWFDDPYSKIGYLGFELLRAVRLVVDTGLHYFEWNRETAAQYMIENLGWGSVDALDRYIIWPGQACAYKIGELKILELRAVAKAELDAKYDIKEFHRVLLQNGSVPLDILENLVNNYIFTN